MGEVTCLDMLSTSFEGSHARFIDCGIPYEMGRQPEVSHGSSVALSNLKALSLCLICVLSDFSITPTTLTRATQSCVAVSQFKIIILHVTSSDLVAQGKAFPAIPFV
jgi:hypothetical protein